MILHRECPCVAEVLTSHGQIQKPTDQTSHQPGHAFKTELIPSTSVPLGVD